MDSFLQELLHRSRTVQPSTTTLFWTRVELRKKVGLTLAQLAKMIGTTASVISRLEAANYEGYSLAMLRRIAAALNKQVEIRFVPVRRSASSGSQRPN
jgi:transcriptional regulator with XRE-family HTH domain